MLPSAIIMLIQIKADCKNYSKNVRYGFSGGKASQGEFRCNNPDCRCDVFYIHGTYERKILTLDPFSENPTISFELDGDLKFYVETLEILRVKCAGCGVTHGIAPVDLIPFSSFSLSSFLLLVMMVYQHIDPEQKKKPVIHENPSISWHVFNRIILTYLEYRDRMRAALRQKGLYMSAQELSDAALIESYRIHPPPCESHRSFLCIHKWPLFVHRRNTVSYPLRFLIPLSLN